MSNLTDAIMGNYPTFGGHAIGVEPEPDAFAVVIRGEVTRKDDPRYSPDHSAIVKTMLASDLPTTVVRWLSLGRKITSIAAR